MKKAQIIVLVILSILFLNCEIKEEITFNKDGSGELFYTYDMSKMLKEMPESKNTDADKDMDTIFDFNSLLNDPKFKDSLAALSPEKRKTLESLRMMKMKLKVDSKEKIAEMGFGIQFKKINEIKDFFKKMEEAQKITKPNKKGNPIKESPLFERLSGKDQNVAYNFDGRNFTRTTTMKKKISEESNKEIDKMINSGDKTKELFGVLKYTLILNFPKKVKKINNKNAVLSNGKKTVTISYGLTEYLENPEKLNLEIKLAK